MEISKRLCTKVEVRELFYRALRETSLKIAESNYEKALRVDGFEALVKNLKLLPFQIARAEYYKDVEKEEELKKERKTLLDKLDRLLATIGLTRQDLTPRVVCAQCDDTGFVGGGIFSCDCFPEF